MMLPSDVLLLNDPAFSLFVSEYASSQSSFFNNFAVDFQTLLELNVADVLSDTIIDTIITPSNVTTTSTPTTTSSSTSVTPTSICSDPSFRDIKTYDVKVGDQSLRFDPNAIHVTVGDTINFNVYSGPHAIHQTIDNTTCQAMDGGFGDPK